MFTKITTFSGNGTAGLGGDGGHRSQASLNVPAGMAYDPMENALLIAEYGAHRIRSVSLEDGAVSTLLSLRRLIRKSSSQTAGTTAYGLSPQLGPSAP